MIFSISNLRSAAWNYPWISVGKGFVEQTLVHICVFLASTHLNISIQKNVREVWDGLRNDFENY